MPKVVEVIYEDGVFKPLNKINLKEGKKIKVEIKAVSYTHLTLPTKA